MKPQCTKAADCLRELARVMDQFGIVDQDGWVDLLKMVNSKYVKYCGHLPNFDPFPEFNIPTDWEFAIAEVEGKPVFLGDELYSVVNGNKYTATKDGWHFDGWIHGICADVAHMSWNPPQPATVMVELTVEDAKKMARDANERLAGTYAYDRVGLACKKALEELK